MTPPSGDAGVRREARFWDRIARRYARTPVADEASYQRKLKITRRFLRPDMEALEIGCGTGSTAIAHAPYLRRIRATDISARMIEIAREKAAAAEVANVTFEQAVLEDLDIPDRSVDAVFALSLLHLLPDRAQAITAAWRMLRPGGVFVTSTACLADGVNWLRPIAAIGGALGLLPPVRFFTADALRQSLTDAGFEIAYDWTPGKRKAVFIVAIRPA